MGYFFPEGLSRAAGAYGLLTKPIYTSRMPLFVGLGGSASFSGTYYRPKASHIGLHSADGQIVVMRTGYLDLVGDAVALLTDAPTLIGETASAGVPEQTLSADTTPNKPFDWGSSLAGRMYNVTIDALSGESSEGGSGFGMVDCRILNNSTLNGSILTSSHVEFLRCTFVNNTAGAGAAAVDTLTADSVHFLGCTASMVVAQDAPMLDLSQTGVRGHRMYDTTLLYGAGVAAAATGMFTVSTSGHGRGFIQAVEAMELHTLGVAQLVDPLLGAHAILVAGDVFYVDSASGSDSNTGTPEQPFATLAYAATQVSQADSLVVVRGTHNEAVDSAIAFNVLATTVACEPGATFVNQGAAITGYAGFEFRGGSFSAGSSAVAGTPCIDLSTAGGRVVGTTFEADRPADMLHISGDFARIDACGFTSTATSTAARPNGLVVTATTGCTVRDTTFDGGAVGFAGYAFDAGEAQVGIRGENVHQVRGADARIHASSSGFWQVTGSATGRVEAF